MRNPSSQKQTALNEGFRNAVLTQTCTNTHARKKKSPEDSI